MSVHVVERLGLFLDGELPAEERAAIASHLRLCPTCTKSLEEMAAVDDTARSLTVEAPAGYFDDFASRVRGRIGAPAKRRVAPPVWSLAAAAALLLGVLTPLVLRQIETPTPVPAAREAVPAAAPSEVVTQQAPATAATAADQLRSKPEAKALPEDARPAPMLEKRRSASRDEAPGPALGPPATVAPPLPPAVAKGAKEEVLARHDAPEPAPKPSAFAGAPAELEADAVKNEAPGRSSGAAAETWPRPRVQGGAAAGRVAANAIPGSTPSELRYQSLVGRPASTAAEARSLREAWRAFAQSEPSGVRADEARVRAIEAAATAYRLSREEADRAVLERDAAEYLARADAAQETRVRALVPPPTVPPPPP